MELSELLNPSQQAAVEHVDGASVIVAGAGSGKTRVITYKIAYLIEQGIPAGNILALTFTNKAAREMRERIMRVVGVAASRPIWMGTFHSIFSKILRIEAESVGFTPQFTIYDSGDSRSLVKAVVRELALDEKVYKPSVVQARISAAKNDMVDEQQYAKSRELVMRDERYDMPLIYNIYQRYQQRLHDANAMDFDDLLLKTARLLQARPDLLVKYQDRFPYILVDEYQDTNAVQHQIVLMLARRHGNICVVGDDAQSIYSFRGARIENILSFRDLFPDCRLFKLEQNYRSTQTIVNAANSLIRANSRQIFKKVFSRNAVGSLIKVHESLDDASEASFLANEINHLISSHTASYADIAILYRVNAQSRVIEDCFRRAKIPYKIYGGLSFYQRKEIRDIIAYLRLAVNHNDLEALKRIINVPARGLGNVTQGRLLAAKMANPDVDTLDLLTSPAVYGAQLAASTANKVAAFADMMRALSDKATEADAYDVVDETLRLSGLMRDAAADPTAEGQSRVENLQEFLSSVHDFCEHRVEQGETDIRLSDFLGEVSLLTDQDNENADNADSVTLMTIHAAKGLEYECIFVVGVEDGLIPGNRAYSEADIEEERRLLYVAITRAKEICTLSYAGSRFMNGQHMFSKPSRFISDISDEYLALPKAYKRRTAFVDYPGRVAELSASSPVLTTVEVGERVVHQKFGEGEVLSVEGEGDGMRAVVRFDNSGEKTLILKFARMKKI